MFKVRVWEVKFEVHMPLPSLPRPDVVVEEVQTTPAYFLEGKKRKDRNGQLVVTIGGRGCFRAGETVTELLPGMAFLHNHQDPQTAYFYPKDGTEPWRFLWIAMHAETTEKMIADINARYGYIFNLPLDRGIVKKLAAYRNFRGAVQVLTPLAAAKLVMDVLSALGDTFENKLIDNPQSILVSRAQDFIMANISKNMGIHDIAVELQVSREHLSRVFREQTGMTAHDYIMNRKTNLALDLLLQTNLSCKEVAERVGFPDHSSFTRAFKNLVGSSPRQIRETGYRPEI